MKSVYEFRAGQSTDLIDGTGRIVCWKGDVPIAIVDYKETEYVLEPHVTWLECSLRDKYQSFKWALDSWKKTVFLIVSKENASLYEQFLNRGLLTKVGVLVVPKAGEEIHMYQKVENE